MHDIHMSEVTEEFARCWNAADYNIKWLLRMIAKKGVPIVWAPFCA